MDQPKHGALKLTRLLRGTVYHRTEGHCYYCGELLEPFGTWQIDHAIPQKQGGTHEIDNLIPSCRTCNLQKKGRTVEEFRQYKHQKHIKVLQSCIEIISSLSFIDQPHTKEAIAALRSIEQTANEMPVKFYGEQLSPTD